ncbi:ESPR-type extended signal peptide-containing protein [Acinetobacter higginsii]|uniref:ESPR-type extended signal peptide-containing protein n=1 Tax=Acinetobacter higginsii TaxID=70347 RepID=UPI0026748DE8|nr:ESPR-type extended signal peptide-containing protein [Acinetobacter higginsii]MDO3666398.1 ESPR-type extended signal peptide-containing protein [Acinetobacter higginsii]
MNKIYRLVWNKSLNLWTVVSENARGVTKKRNVAANNSTQTAVSLSSPQYQHVLLKPSLIAIALSSVFFSTGTFAAVNTGGGNSDTSSSMAISPTAQQCGTGGDATIRGGNGTAVGCGNNISGTDPTRVQGLVNRRGTGNVAYGAGVPTTGSNGGVNSAATSVGYRNTLRGPGGGTLVGNANNSDTSAGFANVLVGQGNSTVGTGGYNTLMGIGNQIVDDPAGTPDGTGIGTNSIAIGVANRVTGQTSIAFGRQTIADADYSIAQGNVATVNKGATGGIALGFSATVNGAQGVAIGSADGIRNYDPSTSARAGEHAVAVGTRTNASTYESVAIGAGSEVTGTDPERAQQLVNRRGTGNNNYPTGETQFLSKGTAVGQDNKISNPGGGTAIGNANTINGTGQHNIAVGQGNRAAGDGYNTALGVGNDASVGNSNTVIGVNNVVRGNTAIAMGRGTNALADFSIAQGNTATVAASATGGIALGNSANTTGIRGIAIGSGKGGANNDITTAPNARGLDSIALGTSAIAANKGAIAIGADASTASTNTKNNQSIAIGEVAQASGDQAIALGANTRAVGDSSIAIGGDDVNRLAEDPTLSAEYTQVTGGTLRSGVYPSTEAQQGATAVGVQAVATGNFSSAYGLTSKATGTASSAFGVQANAEGLGAVAFGAVSQALGHGSLAMGVNATASGNDSTAIGSGNTKDLSARATADGATAVGHRSLANALSATAIGQGAQSTAADATAIGTDAKAQSDNDIAIGLNAATAEGSEGDNIAMGNGVTTGATGKNVAIGSDGTTANSETATGGAVAIGRDQVANGDGAVAIGDPNRASGSGAVALGKDNTAAGDTAASTMASGAVAIGNTNEAIGQGSVAIGNTSKASAAGTIALGDTANAANTSDIAMGQGARAQGITEDGLIQTATAIGSEANADGGNTLAVGQKSVARGSGANALGAGTQATAEYTTAIGNQAKATADYATATGNFAEATAEGATVTGSNAKASGEASSAFGALSNASGVESTAIGAGAQASSDYAVALGGEAQAQATRGTALGSNAVATNADDVALGSGSITSAANPTSNGTVGDITYNYAGTSPSSVVSVGSEGNERQITNVAAGRVSETSTDAINGSQLYSTQQALGNLAESTANHLGGGSTVNPDGSVTAPSYTVNGNNVTNVGAAISELDKGWNLQSNGANGAPIKAGDTVDIGTVAGEENLTVTKDGNNIKYGLNRDLKVDSVRAGDTLINDNGVTIANGPSITKSGINAAGNPISNVSAGVEDTDAVNKGQLDKAAAASKTEVTQGKNITVSKTTGADGQDIYNVATADNVDFNNVTVGGANGVNIDGTTGKISGVTAGEVSATSDEAINGSQLAGTAKSVSDALGGGSTVNPDGTVSAPSYTVNGVESNNVGAAISELDKGWNLQSNGANSAAIKAGDTVDIGTVTGEENLTVTKDGNNIKYGLNRDLKVDSVRAGDTLINDNGVTITNGPSITKSGINAAGNPITNVGAGVEDTDAVNKGQLDKAAAAAKTEVIQGKNITVTKTTGADGQDIYNVATADNVDFNNVTVGDVTIDGTTGKINGVTDGTVAAGSKDAVNGGQLNDSVASTGDILGGGVTNEGGKLNGPFTVSGKGYDTVADAIQGEAAAAKTEVEAGKNMTVESRTGADGQTIYEVATADDVDFNKVTVGGANGVNIDGSTGKISGVTAGEVSATSDEVINGSQLAGTAKSVSDALGGGSTVNPDGTVSVPSYTVNGVESNNVGAAISELDKGWNLQSNGANSAAIKAGDTVDIGTVTGEENLTVTKDGNNIKYGLNRDLKVDSVRAGDTLINDNGVTITNGPSITKSGINAAGNPITNVGAGVAGTDAVNKDQLDDAAAAAKTEVTQGKNITVTKSIGTDGQDIYNVATANDVDFNNVTVGGANGVRIDGTTGKISGVTAGDVNATSTDAINGSQLAGTAKSVSDALGGGSVVNPDGTVTAPSYTVNGETVRNVGDAITELDKGWNLQSNGANAGAIRTGDTVDIGTVNGEENLTVTKDGNNIKYGLNRDLKVDSVRAGDTLINDNGVTIANGPSITKSGINAAGNPISNVGAGVDDTDAVNKGQLDKAAAASKTEVTQGKNITVSKTTGADGQDIYNVATADNVDFNNVTVGGANGVTIDGTTGKISGVADGTIAAGSKDAVNGGQLNDSVASTGDILGGGVTNEGGKLNGPFTVSGKGYDTVADAIQGEAAAAKTEVTEGKNVTVTKTTGADGQDIYNVATKDDVSFDSVQVGDVNIDGTTGKISGVTDGTIAAGSKDAVNGGQLHGVADSVRNSIGGETTLNPDGSITTANVGNTGENNIHDAIDSVRGQAVAAKTEVEAGKNMTVESRTGADGQTIYEVATADDVDFNNVTVGGANGVNIDGTTGKISGVADGTVAAGSKDAVNGGQLNDSVASTGDILGGGVTNEGGKLNGPFTVSGKGYDTVADAIQGEAAAAKTEVTEGKNVTVTKTTGADGQDIYNVATKDDVSFDSVQVGDVNIDGVTGKISGIADGTIAAGSKDAVNGGQLHGVADSVRNSIGGETTLNPDGSITTANVGNTGQNNIHDAIDSVRGQAVAAKTTVTEGDNMVVTQSKNADGSTNYEVSTARDVDFDSVQVGDVNIDAATGKISGVADGTVAAGSKDAVNGGQLNDSVASTGDILGGGVTNEGGKLNGPFTVSGKGYDTVADAIQGEAAASKTEVTEGKNVTVTKTTGADGQDIYNVATKDDVSFDSVQVGDVNIDGATGKISGVADGSVTAGSKDAVNGGQIHGIADSVKNSIGGETILNPDGSITTANVGNTGQNNIHDAIDSVRGQAVAAKTTVTEGNNMVVTQSTNPDGSTNYEVATARDVDFDSVQVGDVNIDGATGKISGVADGTIAAGSKDAVNGGQLNDSIASTGDILGGGVTNDGGKLNGPFTVNDKGYDTVADAIQGEAAASKTEVTEGKNVTVTKTTGADGQDIYNVATKDDVDFNNVTVGGPNGVNIDGSTGKISGVADGTIAAGSKDAVNGGQLNDSVASTGDILGGGVTNEGGKLNGPFTVNDKGYDTVADAIQGEAAAAKTEVEAGKNMTVESRTGTDGQTIYEVATADDVSFDSVQVGDVNIDGTTGKISGIADGTIAVGSKDAVNGGQLNDSIASTGDILGGGVTNEGGKLNGPFTVSGKGYDTVADAIQGEAAASKTEVTEGKNVTVTKTTGADGQDIYNVATKDDVSFDSVQVGNVNIDGTTGKISGVADGTIAAGSKDAINGGQIHGIADSVKNSIGGETTLNPDGSITTGNVGNTGQNNIHDAIDSVRGQAVAAKTTVTEGDNMVVTQSKNADGSTNYEVATAKDVKFDSVTATDADGNETILDAKGVSLKDQAGNTTILGQDGLGFADSMGNSVGPRISARGIDAGNTVITGVAPGRIATDSQDAINGSQLKGVADSVAGAIGGNTTVNSDGSINTSNIGGTGKDNINDAIGAVGDAAKAAKTTVSKADGDENVTVTSRPNDEGGTDFQVGLSKDIKVDSVTAGDTVINGDGLTIAGGPSVTKDGIDAGDNKVTGVADGTVAAGSKDAINGGQLHGVADSVKNVVGGNAKVNPDGSITTSNVGGTGKNNIDDAINSVRGAAAAAKSTVSNKDGNISVNETTKADGSKDYEVGLAKDIQVDSVTAANQVNVGGAGGTTIAADGVRIAEGPSITKGGIDAGSRKVTAVAEGAIAADSKDAINGSQLHKSYENVAKALGGGAGYDPSAGWTAPSYQVGGNTHNNVGDALNALNNADQALGDRITNLGDQMQQAFYDTNQRIDDVKKMANAGVAAAMALETAPYISGKYTYAVGAAYHGGENAVGLTLRKTADNGRWSLTTGVAAASQGDPSFRVGLSGVFD